jgi:predicted metal-binding transcription factor (methanogenesis marker protein 9)
MPWTVHERPADGDVLLNTHPMSPEEAMDLAHQLAGAARRVHRAVEERKKAKAAPPKPEVVRSLEGEGNPFIDDGLGE